MSRRIEADHKQREHNAAAGSVSKVNGQPEHLGSNRVSQVVWPWRASNQDSKPKDQRPRALVEGAIGIAAGLVFLLLLRQPILGCVVMAIGGSVALTGFFLPSAYARLRRGVAVVARAVGLLMAWLLLVPFFYLCFPLGRLIFSLLGKDPLNRKFLPDAESYWSERHGARDASSYGRQF